MSRRADAPPVFGNFPPVFGGISRQGFRPPPEPLTTSSVWTAAEVALWRQASGSQRRQAVRLRWYMRAHVDPASVPRPACPVCRLMWRKEVAYRDESACRGVIQDD